jgi:hypothetical protein
MPDKPVEQQRRYLSYLLRLWQESSGDLPQGNAPRGPPLWRASLERPQNGERLGFASLVDLFAFLESETRVTSRGLGRSAEEESQPPQIPD